MIWLAAIFLSVLASNDEACIIIAEKAYLRKKEVFESILKDHPEFKKNELRWKITEDVFYYCLNTIEQHEAQVLKYDSFNRLKWHEHLMYIKPSKYKTKEDLTLSLGFEIKYAQLEKERNRVIRKLKKLPELSEEEEEKENKKEEIVKKEEKEDKNDFKKPKHQRNKEFQATSKTSNQKSKEDYKKLKEGKAKTIHGSQKGKVNYKNPNEKVESEEILQKENIKTKEDL